MKFIAFIIPLIFVYCSTTVKTTDNDLSPFCPTTQIKYGITRNQNVLITIYDDHGIIKDTLVNKIQEAGKYSLTTDFSSYRSGLYFFRFKGEDTIYTKKILLIK